MLGKGNTSEAGENMEFNAGILANLVSEGYVLTTTCPSCGLFLKRYYPKILGSEEAREVSENLVHITDYLLRLDRMGLLNTDFVPMSWSVFYHTACHLRAQLREQHVGNYSLELLQKIPGVNVSEVSEACCGMAGSYGLQKTHYELSQAIGAELLQRVAEFRFDRVVDDCGACGFQIEGGTGRKVDHPILLLHEAYGLGRSRRQSKAHATGQEGPEPVTSSPGSQPENLRLQDGIQ
jgi:glycerol-3-phosphate dehydrogenase subunit C